MKKEKLLILFSKWPKKGNSKSRIARAIGENRAEKFCFACLNDLIGKIKNLKGIDFVVVPNTIEESHLFTNKYGVFSQSLDHLGIPFEESVSEVFHKLFNHFLREYKKVSLIPMDIPHVDIKIIGNSFEKLENHNQVFGSEENGGVYLIGLRELPKTTFKNVRWSTENSFKDLIRNCESPSTLTMFFDLNTLKDFARLNQPLLASCPHLTRFIKSLIFERITMRREVLSI